MPPTIFYMMARGGFIEGNWKFLSFSGLVYLGIGDTAVWNLICLTLNQAAVFGSLWGKQKWSDYSGKTIDGSTYMGLGLLAANFILSLLFHPSYLQFVSFLIFLTPYSSQSSFWFPLWEPYKKV